MSPRRATPRENKLVRKPRNVPQTWRKCTAELLQHCPCGVTFAGRTKYQDTKLSLRVISSNSTHCLRLLTQGHSVICPGQSSKDVFLSLSYSPFRAQTLSLVSRLGNGASCLRGFTSLRDSYPFITLDIDYRHFQMDGDGMFIRKELFSFTTKD